MNPIGRKLYIDFGDYIIAIEKYTKEYSSSMGLELNGQENPSELYDIFDVMGQRLESKVLGKQTKKYGCDVNTYVATPRLWLTKEEFENL